MMYHLCRRGTSPRIDFTRATERTHIVLVFAILLVRAPRGNAQR